MWKVHVDSKRSGRLYRIGHGNVQSKLFVFFIFGLINFWGICKECVFPSECHGRRFWPMDWVSPEHSETTQTTNKNELLHTRLDLSGVCKGLKRYYGEIRQIMRLPRPPWWSTMPNPWYFGGCRPRHWLHVRSKKNDVLVVSWRCIRQLLRCIRLHNSRKI